MNVRSGNMTKECQERIRQDSEMKKKKMSGTKVKNYMKNHWQLYAMLPGSGGIHDLVQVIAAAVGVCCLQKI